MLVRPGPGSAARLRRCRIVDALIIIILLFLLAGLLFPTVAGWETNRHTRGQPSLSNLKHLAAAVLEFAEEHDGHLPCSDTWAVNVSPYLESGRFFRSPDDPTAQPVSYAMVDGLSEATLSSIRSPAQTPLLYEAEYGRPAAWHNGGLYVAFADGHAKWYPSLPDSAMQSPGGKDNPVTDRNPHQ